MSDKKHIKLSDLPKRDPYLPPAGYFDNLQQKIDKRIVDGKRAEGIQITWKHIRYAVAASVILVVAVLVAIRNPVEQHDTARELIAQVSIEDCLMYLESSDIDIDEIISGTSPEVWDEALLTPASFDSLFDDPDLDLLYEHYGATSDENLQTL